MKWADRLLAAWYQGHPALLLLRPLEWLYRCVAQRKRQRFLTGQMDSYRAPVPVVVVGNITVGGTGKTPMILWLIDYCRSKGLRAGVISRGYGATPQSYPHQVRATDSAEQAGDEPLLIVQRSQVPLAIDPNRAEAAQALLAEHQLDVLLCDDGLQHYRLARDLELVLIDNARGLGNQRCLPAGPLREPAQRLASVDAVLCNGATADSATGFAMQLQPSCLVHLKTGQRLALDHFAPGQKLHAVAGIGNPQRFFNTVQTLHWQPIPHAFADHAQYSPEALAFADDLPVLMTEKDAVKCRAFAADNWWYLAIDAQPSTAFVRWLDQQFERLFD